MRTDISTKDKYRQMPMHCTAGYRDIDAIKLLKEMRLDISAKDNSECMPMHAILKKFPDTKVKL